MRNVNNKIRVAPFAKIDGFILTMRNVNRKALVIFLVSGEVLY